MPFDIGKRWASYMEPYEPLKYAAWSLRVTVIDAFKFQGLSAISGMPRWRDQAFTLWYKTLNQHFQRYEATTAVPTLVSHANGLVVDLGPALGNQLQSFNLDNVTQIYGIEKNAFFVKELEGKIQESNIRDKYAVITCGIEDTDIMEQAGIEDGNVDTVLCIQVLCSVSDPLAVARRLYKLLRPGGKLIFWEHHGNEDTVTRIFQTLWNPFWRFGVGDCNMTRDIVRILNQAGNWENIESIQGEQEPWSMMPRVWGELVKSNQL
ncbi:hypothetical protein E8E14_004817 [Neopestalotiopsis sp. 37M]|nr:hypothetical protein E8E14_004817 [Neopestalotiopsis sp. 37M]